MEIANVIPIPKVKNPTTSNEYRPIALTSAIFKEFERIIDRKILNHTKQLWKTNKHSIWSKYNGCFSRNN